MGGKEKEKWLKMKKKKEKHSSKIQRPTAYFSSLSPSCRPLPSLPAHHFFSHLSACPWCLSPVCPFNFPSLPPFYISYSSLPSHFLPFYFLWISPNSLSFISPSILSISPLTPPNYLPKVSPIFLYPSTFISSCLPPFRLFSNSSYLFSFPSTFTQLLPFHPTYTLLP